MNDQLPDFEPPAPMFEDPKPKKERKKPAKRRKVAKKVIVTVPAPKRAKKVKATDGRLKANRKAKKRRVMQAKPTPPAGQQTVSDATYAVLAALIRMNEVERDQVTEQMRRLFK